MAVGRNLRRWLGVAAAGLAIGGAGAAVAVASSTGGAATPEVQEAPAISSVQDSATLAADAQPGSNGPDLPTTPRAAEPNEPKGMDRPNDTEGPGDAQEPGEMAESEPEETPTGPAAVSEDQARATAGRGVPGGTVTETEREVEHGVDAYEVAVEAPDGRVIEVGIDSQNGEVVHIGEGD